MRTFAWTTLRTRLLVLIGLAVIPSLGLMVYTDWEQRQHAAAEAQANALRLTRLAAANQSRVIEGAQQLLIALAQFPDELADAPAECTALMARILKAHPSFTNLGVVTPEGRWVCSAEPIRGADNAAGEAWFQRAVQAEGFAIGDYQVSQAETLRGKAIVNFAYPVRAGDGRLQVLVVATLDLSWLNELATELQFPAGTTLTLVDEHGTILTRYPDAAYWVGQTVPEAPVIKDVLARQAEGVTQALGLDGIPRLFAFTPLRDDGQDEKAYLLLGVPAQMAFAEADQALQRNLAVLSLALLLAVVTAWIGTQVAILRPISQLLEATRQIAQGNFRSRARSPSTASELGQLAQAFDTMSEALEQKERENARLLEDVRRLASIDSLTGLYNRRQFFALAEREFARARRFREPLSAIMLDIDLFKQINDTYGHAAGDQVLQEVAQRCVRNIRQVDILGRYGGDELVLLLPETEQAEAGELAERLRQCVADPLTLPAIGLTVTISLGIAALTDNTPDLASLIHRADVALYRAKAAGRNRIEGESASG